MGSVEYQQSSHKHISICPDAAKEEKLRGRPSPGHPGLVFSSLWVGSTDFSARETTLSELEQELLSTWLLSWSIWLQRYLSWQATLLVTTRRPGSSPDICNWLSVMMRS